MAFNELEIKRYEKIIQGYVDKHRPPPHIRPELDLACQLNGQSQSVTIFEIRPMWRGETGQKTELPVAKATYIKAQNHWKVFWQRADLKWYSYEPHATAESLEEFFAVVKKDEYCCFYG